MEDAVKYGAIEALLLNYIIFWVAKNKIGDRHFHDGRTWTYNSVRAFQEYFPCWSLYQIRRGLKVLEKQGAIIVGNYNKLQCDRTLWYALSDESLVNRYLNKPMAQTAMPSSVHHSSNGSEPQTHFKCTNHTFVAHHAPLPEDNHNKTQKKTQKCNFSEEFEMTPEIEEMLKERARVATGRSK